MKHSIPLALMLSVLSVPAHAKLKVDSPHVEEGVLEFEYTGRYDHDKDNSIDGFSQHVLETKYGLNAWFAAAIENEVEHIPNDGTSYTATAVEAQFQFSEPGEYWLDSGAIVEYEFSHEARSADKLEASLLLQKEIGRIDTIVNLNLEREVGQYHSGGTEAGFGISSRYRLNPYFEPGVEWYGELGRVSDIHGWDEQEHSAGPVIYGKLGYGFSYEAGYLFGLTDAAPEGSAKLVVEYEFPL